jgi:hypothetical protein
MVSAPAAGGNSQTHDMDEGDGDRSVKQREENTQRCCVPERVRAVKSVFPFFLLGLPLLGTYLPRRSLWLLF